MKAAADGLEMGLDFKKTINQLEINLEGLNLTLKTKELFEALKSTYGEPVEEKKEGGIFSNNWRVSEDADLAYTGGGWVSKKQLEKEKKSSCLSNVVFAFIFLLIAVIMLVLMWTPILSWLKSKVGATVFYGGLSLLFLLYF